MGAHPGYPDLVGLWPPLPRHDAATELEAAVLYQIGALAAFAQAAGGALAHVKPHGALYNRARGRPAIGGADRPRRAPLLRGPDPGRAGRVAMLDAGRAAGPAGGRRSLRRPRLRGGRHLARSPLAGRRPDRTRLPPPPRRWRLSATAMCVPMMARRYPSRPIRSASTVTRPARPLTPRPCARPWSRRGVAAQACRPWRPMTA